MTRATVRTGDRQYVLAGIALGAAIALAACARGPAEIVLTGSAMGTTWTLRAVPATGDIRPDDVEGLVASVLDEVDVMMSAYRPDSALSRFNAASSTEWQPVPAPLAALVAQALALGTLTGGAFDITVAPLVTLWGFGPGEPRAEPPGDEEVAATLTRTGLRHLRARQSPAGLAKAVPDLMLDLDAIAPGYAVDLVAERLEDAGIDRYMIEIGGEVRVHGRNADGVPWRIGIERPETAGRSVARVLELDAMAVSTSGDYRDFFETGGARYSHTLDPRSGRPVTHGLASVTVLRPTAAEADALATALSVLGPVDGFELAERSGWAALFVERTATGFEDRETTAFAPAARRGESRP